MTVSKIQGRQKETIGQLLVLVLVDLCVGKSKHKFWMWTFFTLGVMMVCFSEAFSQLLVPKSSTGGYRTDQAAEIATALRFLGVMVFNVGLAERIVMLLHGNGKPVA